MEHSKDTSQMEMQTKRTKDKLAYMVRYSPKQVSLKPPAERKWLEDFEARRNIRLPEDYREILLCFADGGSMPDVCNRWEWKSLKEMEDREAPLDVPYPPGEDEKALLGQMWKNFDAVDMSGQILLMGRGDLWWSLITAGPCAGEVWTGNSFKALRAPGCTFAQWLELVLDGNLETYLMDCLTGEKGPMARTRRFLDLWEREDLWQNGKVLWPEGTDPVEQCARWLEENRFVYEGPNPGWGEYLKGHLHSELRPLPQETDKALTILRAAQQEPDWTWGRPREQILAQLLARDRGTVLGGKFQEEPKEELDKEQDESWIRWEDSEEMACLGKLVKAIRQDGEEEARLKTAPEEERLFDQALSLTVEKSFQRRGVGIRDLSFLEGLTNLKTLDLWNNDVEDLSVLATLENLKELNIPYNLISDLSPLAGLNKLVELRIYGNKITSLEPLRGLSNLNVLSLRGNPLEPGTLACLRKCKRLGMLDLRGTNLKNVRDLEFCRAWSLNLCGNPDLTGLEVLTTMKRLTSLCLDTQVARRYEIQALAPHLIEHVELGGISMYVWPEKYY